MSNDISTNSQHQFTILDGKETAHSIKEDLKSSLQAFRNTYNISTSPELAVVSVGTDLASAVYVRGKMKDCYECGFICNHISLPEDTTIDKIKSTLRSLSEDDHTNGIILQLPLPASFTRDDEMECIAVIDPRKDVDCFTNENIGKLYHNEADFAPCTPAGIIELLNHWNINVAGKNVCIVNRSDIVGKPLSLMMCHRNATVTLCHSKTTNIEEKMKNADILVIGVGKAGFINKYNVDKCIKDGAVIVDVGINRDRSGKVVGDCDWEAIKEKVSYASPVPGGVGLMTRAELLINVFKAYCLQNKNRLGKEK